MLYAMLSHKVKDYGVWRPLYDADEGRRNKYGITTINVFRDLDDPNKVYAYWQVTDRHQVEEMGKLPELQEVIKKAGVVGEPEIHFFQDT